MTVPSFQGLARLGNSVGGHLLQGERALGLALQRQPAFLQHHLLPGPLAHPGSHVDEPGLQVLSRVVSGASRGVGGAGASHTGVEVQRVGIQYVQ